MIMQIAIFKHSISLREKRESEWASERARKYQIEIRFQEKTVYTVHILSLQRCVINPALERYVYIEKKNNLKIKSLFYLIIAAVLFNWRTLRLYVHRYKSIDIFVVHIDLFIICRLRDVFHLINGFKLSLVSLFFM